MSGLQSKVQPSMKGVREDAKMEERFTPQMFINYVASRRGRPIGDLGVAPVVVLSWSRRVIESMAKTIGARLSRYWHYGDQYPLYVGKVEGNPVSLGHVPIGSAGTVMVMEEMIACGGRVFLGLGWAGSLQREAPVGTFVIPTSCIREEGTSLHYAEDGAAIRPSERVLNALKTACKESSAKILSGPVWTTDAPYRELKAKIEAYRRQGVIGVDMETSAMYALGQFRNVGVCNLLVVSDELWREWKPAFSSTGLRKSMERAERVIERCICLIAQERGR